MKLARLLIAVSTMVALPAAADPQFMTLERADRQSRLGLQASFQLYPDLDDVFGLRTELYGQVASATRGGGGAFGGYAHLALGFLFADEDNENGVSNAELGGYYVTRVGRGGSDLVLHIGLSLPTASDDLGSYLTNLFTGLERNYDLVDTVIDTTALRFGGTLKSGLGASGFLQADFTVDVLIDAPGDNDPLFHANLGLGTFLSSNLALMGEGALTFSSHGDLIGSLGIGLRFPGAAHPHIGYVMAFADDDSAVNDGGIVAHIFSFGFYASL